MLPGINPLDVPGNIVTAGSSTVFPLSERMVERFKDEGFAGNISVDSIGSGAGFERFCSSGETDISNASRAINGAEVTNCQAIGREPIEIRVGTDALAVVVSKDNTFADNVSMEQLHALFSTATNWSDINPDWPGEPIQRFIPGTDSGTFDYFVEAVFDKHEEPILSAGNLQMSEDDNILVQGVLGGPYSVGFFGYAYYAENADKLNVLDIDGVEASKESVDDASYPLARPLFIYTTADIMMDKPQVAAFVNFYLTYVNEEVATSRPTRQRSTPPSRLATSRPTRQRSTPPSRPGSTPSAPAAASIGSTRRSPTRARLGAAIVRPRAPPTTGNGWCGG